MPSQNNRNGLSEKELRQAAEAAEKVYKSLPSESRSKLFVLVAAIVLGGLIWYFALGGKATVANTFGQGDASNVTQPQVTAIKDGSGTYAPSQWDKAAAPDYYLDEGAAIVSYGLSEAGQIEYGGIDALGRSTWAAANVTAELVEESSGWRCEFDSDVDKISGWGHNAEADVPTAKGTTHTWFYNRSHLLADSLGGYRHVYNADGSIDTSKSRSERKNLVTGTRTQNVGLNDGDGGMVHYESMATEWAKAHPDGYVYYAATAVYEGDELVPRSVFVDVLSSDGSLNVHGEVFNVTEGYVVDYATGEFSKA